MASSTITPDNYVEMHLPPAVIKRLESGAFQSLCEHLRERSDEVPNIDLMTLSGFCRNCLSKWLVVEARKLSDSIHKKAAGTEGGETLENEEAIVQALDAMGYDEAAQHVYGMMYPEWKKRHAQKASDDQMEKFQKSKPLWATHDKQVLAKRREETPEVALSMNISNNTDGNTVAGCTLNRNNDGARSTAAATPQTKSSLLSNVCCEDIDNIDNTSTERSSSKPQSAAVKTFVPPALPEISFSLGILTVSDRASSGEYPEGDLSGPMVKDVVISILESLNNTHTETDRVETTIVPDDIDVIQTTLINWSTPSSETSQQQQQQPLDMIITTGGTGFSVRDVTPEATAAVLERPCDGLMAFCSLALQTVQPLAALSRGTAGVRGNTLIVNLPGNPKAVQEILPILLPLALQAVADMKQHANNGKTDE